MIIVSRKPIMAGYQLLVFKMLYIYMMLICDTLINYYLLTLFSLIYEDLSNIHTTKIADYIVTENCPSNHLMPIIALLRIHP